jgi:hypothetical protein
MNKAIDKIDTNKKERFISIYSQDEVRGNVSLTCDAAGISRQTYYNWLEDDESFRNGIYEAKMRMCDDMEQVLVSRAIDKDTTALIFWLKKNHDVYKDTPQMMQQINVGSDKGNTITFVDFKNEPDRQ